MRIAQIGLGAWGEKNSEILSQLGVLSCVFDGDSEKSKEIGQKYSVKFYDSLQNLQSSEDFDAFCLDSAIPNSNDLISDLLYKKKHVFLEKPITNESGELEKLKEISQNKKVLFSCGLTQRFSPTLKKVKNIAKEQKFGGLISLEIYREVPLEAQNKEIIFNNSLSDIDAANQIFGEMPVVVFSRLFTTDEEKFANIVLGYQNNKSANILSNFFPQKNKAELRVIFSQKTIIADLVGQKIQDFEENIEEENSMLLQMNNFVGAVQGNNELEVDANNMVNLTQIAEAAFLSGKQGVPIYLDLK